MLNGQILTYTNNFTFMSCVLEFLFYTFPGGRYCSLYPDVLQLIQSPVILMKTLSLTLTSTRVCQQDCTFKTTIESLHLQVPKLFLSLTSTPKIAQTGKKIIPQGSKSEKRPKIWLNLKQKDRVVLPKQKLIVYISRFQKFFEPDLYPIFKFQF